MTEKLTYESPATRVVEIGPGTPILADMSIPDVTWEGYEGEEEII